MTDETELNGQASGGDLSTGGAMAGVADIERSALTEQPIMVPCPSWDLERKTSLLDLDDWQSLRWLHFREGKSVRWIAKEFGISRNTVAKYVKQPDAPKYAMTVARTCPVADNWKERIKEILEGDKGAPRKQRHTARRIFDRLVEEDGYTGSARTIRSVVASLKKKPAANACVPLVFEPGKDAQVDFGEAYAYLANELVKLHGFELRLSYSRRKFVMYFLTPEKEAFLEGHVRAFGHIEGVPQRLSYDNPGALVAQVGKGKHRVLTKEFKELKGFYSFETNFCKPGEEGAHEKGGVESGIGFSRRNWMVPPPKFDSLEELNEYILRKCIEDESRCVEGQTETIGEAWEHEKRFLLPIPSRAFDPAVRDGGLVDSYCTVPFKNNHYSVPSHLVGKALRIRSYWNRIVISDGFNDIAEHPRSFGKDEYVLKPEHYLELLERRPHAVPYARPLVQAEWPEGYWSFYEEMVERQGAGQAGRDFIKLLKCHVKYGGELVSAAISEARNAHISHADGVIAIIDRYRYKSMSPEHLDLTGHPALAQYSVTLCPEPAQYDTLRHGGTGHDQQPVAQRLLETAQAPYDCQGL
jgi:transposase